MSLRLAVAVGVCLAAAWPSDAQSLGDVARREAARRGEVQKPGPVYTNADLARDFTTPPPAPAPKPAPAAPGPGAAASPGDGTAAEAGQAKDEQDGVTPRDQQEPQAPSDRDEKYWRSRAEQLRSRLAAKNREIEALRERLASFGGSADPEKDVAAQALKRAVGDLDAFNDEWLRFERLAREQGVPDTWIR